MTVGTSYFITGASRGIGLELCTQILETQPDAVVAAGARSVMDRPDLLKLGLLYRDRCFVVELDVTNETSIKGAMKALREILPGGLDYLICSAGVVGYNVPPTKDTPTMVADVFKTNVYGVLAVIQATLPLLEKGNKKTVVNMSSVAGSRTAMADMAAQGLPYSGLYMGYKMSKNALNMMTQCLAVELKDKGFTLVALHPGLVMTDMGASVADYVVGVPQMDPPTSALAILKTMAALTPDKNGAYIDYDGNPLPP